MNPYYEEEAHAADHARHASAAANRVGLGMLSMLLVPVGVSIFVQIVGYILFPAWVEGPYFTWFNQIFSMYLVATPICLLLIGTPPSGLPKKEKAKMPFLHLLTVFCIMEAVGIFGSLISNLLMSLFGLISGSVPSSPLDDMLAQTPLWIIFLVVVVIGPLVEEIVCRAAIMDRLLPFGEKTAILVSALCFGIMHENFYQLFYATGLGILLGYVYARTRKLSYVTVLHMCFNCLGSFVPMALTSVLDLEMLETADTGELLAYLSENILPFIGLLLYEALAYGAALAGVILFCIFVRRVKIEAPPLPLPRGRAGRTLFGNAGMILFLAAGLLFLVLSLFLY